MEDVKQNGYEVDLITLEVGSRGFIYMEGFRQLKDILLLTRSQLQLLTRHVSAAAITGSYKIWTSRNHYPDE